MNRGLFITFEGVEGAGKTTQIALLARWLEESGHSVCITREPGGDSVAEGVRSLLLEKEMTPRAELLLFLASRAQNVERIILPHLERKGIVLCDRFIDSSIAYQGYARGLGCDHVTSLNEFATGGLIPDVTFLLDLSPEVGLARQSERNRMESEELSFHQQVREGFLMQAANNQERFCVLDAMQQLQSLHKDIINRVERELNDRI